MDKLTVQPQDASKTNVRLILNSTKADLEAAPEFKSVALDPRDRERQHRQHHDAGPCSAGLRLDQPVALGSCAKRPDMGRFVHF